MDFTNRDGRLTSQKKSFEPETPHTPRGNSTSMDIGKIGGLLVLFGTAALLAMVVVALIFGGKININRESSLIDTDKYQAVFLEGADGQVYFGKLGIYNNDLYALTDIYYLRVEEPIQPEGSETRSNANVSLAKLGKELHAPEDYMFISRDKVMFWENLKDDGQVVKAIKQYETNGPQQTTTQPTTDSDETSEDSTVEDTTTDSTTESSESTTETTEDSADSTDDTTTTP